MPAYNLLTNTVGNWPGSAQGRPNPMVPDPSDYPVVDSATGKLVSLKTGKLWSGKNPWDQKDYRAGTVMPEASPGVGAIDPNNPSERYKPVDIVKSPGVASAADELLKNFQQSASDSLKGFNDYLKNYQTATSEALKAGERALDIAPTEAALRAQQGRYAGALAGSARDYAALNAEDAAAQHGIVRRAQDILPEYDTAEQNIANRQLEQLRQNISGYKLGTGTPTSLGSDEERILARGAADVLLPMEQARIGRKYDSLTKLELPIQRDITERKTARISSFDPMVASQTYQSGSELEKYIQNLKMQVANMSYAEAEAYLRSLAVPAQLRNQILSGEIGTLGGIAGLEDASRYRGLQDVLGVNPSQPQYYNVGQPPYPAPSRYGGGIPVSPTVTASGRLAPNAPAVTGTAPPGVADYLDPRLPAWVLNHRRGTSPASRYQEDLSSGGYWDADQGQWYPSGTAAV